MNKFGRFTAIYAFFTMLTFGLLNESLHLTDSVVLLALTSTFVAFLLATGHLRLLGEKPKNQLPVNVPLALVAVALALVWSFYGQLNLLQGLFATLTALALASFAGRLYLDIGHLRKKITQ